MGRYKRTSTRHTWTEDNMKEAIMAIREKKMGWLLASKTFNVPSTTLRRRVNTTIEGWKNTYMGGYKVTFNKTLENEIVEHLKNLEVRFFGLTTTDVRKLAYQVAEAKKIPHRFSHAKKMAGWDWLKGFRNRNPAISLRTPESTSFARALSTRNRFKNIFHYFLIYWKSTILRLTTYGMLTNQDSQQCLQRTLTFLPHGAENR